jgi:hypothetical protein
VGLRDCRIAKVSVRRAHARELKRTSCLPKRYGPGSRGNPQGHSGTVARRIRRTANFPPNLDKRARDKNIAFEWMRAVLQKKVDIHSLRSHVDGLPELV